MRGLSGHASASSLPVQVPWALASASTLWMASLSSSRSSGANVPSFRRGAPHCATTALAHQHCLLKAEHRGLPAQVQADMSKQSMADC